MTVEAAFDGNGTFYNETAYCRFGAAAVEAFVMDDTRVSCRVPPEERRAQCHNPQVSVGIVGDAPGAIPSPGRDDPSYSHLPVRSKTVRREGGSAISSQREVSC